MVGTWSVKLLINNIFEIFLHYRQRRGILHEHRIYLKQHCKLCIADVENIRVLLTGGCQEFLVRNIFVKVLEMVSISIRMGIEA